MNVDYRYLNNLLKDRLTQKRYIHSLAVAEEAKRLAVKYNGNPEKAHLAGLLHDITKNASKEEHLNIFSSFGIILNDVEKNAEKLWHAISGAAYIKNILKIDDDEIIDAVRYHTTAKADMSLTALILYLADFTSADRDYDDVDIIRAYVNESLEKAYIYALRYSIKDLVDNGRAIHIDTVSAYNEAVIGRENLGIR
ncbi:MAG: bis(5'-nucleosyl)-tetraphosphatase (symmetrical) YqeK [Clostridia bacterium]|nr:bis(5'-nucleosyl)-tetraphosphatase (symmetrical) YqeK [Clostridia bacterium]